VQSIERAAAVIRLLASSSAPLSLSEVAASLDLAKTTSHGILRTLLGVGFVAQDPRSGRYQVSDGLLRLRSDRLDANDLRARAINLADALATQTRESVRIAVLSDGCPQVVHHVFRPDDSIQTMEVGSELPGHATALGKVLLAWLPVRPSGPTTLPRYTGYTVISRRALAQALVEVRMLGWASEVQEHSMGQGSIAAPLRGVGGFVVGAIAVTGRPDRLFTGAGRPQPTPLAAVLRAAQAISRQLHNGTV
jgi:DNA-binding IclR family transcriptional regulator